MLTSPTQAPIWVNQPAGLLQAAQALSNVPYLAVDTESNSLFAYREQVCLIQCSTGKQDYLIDTLALKDLSPLAPVFANPNIEKIFHAAEYDLICLKRDYGFSIANLFDTMVVARILGRKAVGLGSMLENEFGIHVDKRYQRANWGERPLSQAMLDYARLDSFYLIPLRHNLHAELESSDRMQLAQEDFLRLCQVEAGESQPEVDFWRISGARDLPPRQAAVLQELFRYREQRAKAANVPPFKILGNQVLMDLAISCPPDEKALEALGVLSPRLRERHAANLLVAIQRGLQSAPAARPPRHPRDDARNARLDSLRNWRKARGAELGVESDVILPRNVLEQIAELAPASLDELRPILIDLPWRMEHYGSQILKALEL